MLMTYSDAAAHCGMGAFLCLHNGKGLPVHYLVVLFNSEHYGWTQSRVNGNNPIMG
jgi:hypothetical protein